ncbi:MAG: hypothetical protein V4439_04175 [Patescibacteria group bacterium]
MKKIILFVLFSFIIPTISVFATSGACSYHGGVNCSVGATYTGKVQCNDGWVNSSVYFSDTDECRTTSYDSCPQIVYGLSCSTESDYARVQQEVDAQRATQRAMSARSGLLGSSFDTSSTLGQDKLDSCRRSIELFNATVTSRNQCLQEHEDTLRQQTERAETSIQIRFNALCVKYNGSGSVWDSSLPSDNNNPPCTKPLKISTYYLPNAMINTSYSANINYTPIEETPVLRFYDLPESIELSFLNFNGNNGAFALKLTPKKVGVFILKARVVVKDVEIGSTSFNLTVDDPTQVKTPVQIPIVAPVELKIQNQITPKKISIPSKNSTGNFLVTPKDITTLNMPSVAPVLEIPVNPEPVRKIKWYQKIFNWFK